MKLFKAIMKLFGIFLCSAIFSSSLVWASPQYGGRIILGTIGEPSNLIPYMSTDSASNEVSGMLYTSLLEFNKDLEVVNLAASSHEIIDNGRIFRFTLRNDVYWEDGVKLTVDDVEFTYKLMIDPKTPTAYAQDFLAISKFKKLSDLSFEVYYEQPFARAVMTWMGAILPKHILEGQDLLTTAVARKPVGVGPYKFKSWEPGAKVTLVASDKYFKGKPYIDEVIFRIIPDPSTMFLELKAKNLDMMSLSPQQYLRQTTGPIWEEEWNKYQYLAFSYTFLGYNLRHPFFQDVRVRRALSLAIDRKSLISGVLLGQGVPTIGPYAPGTWPYNNQLKTMDQDMEQAKNLLKQAGWSDTDHDGWLDRDGKPFAFTILVNQGNDQRIKTGIIIQSQFKDLGIKVQVRTVEWAAFIKEFINKGQFDAVILAWTITQDPDIFDVWHSSRAVPGGLNFTNYKNAELDALLIKARSLTYKEERKVLYHKIQEILHADQPYSFLYVPYSLPIVSSRIQNIKPSLSGIIYNFKEWWIKTPTLTP